MTPFTFIYLRYVVTVVIKSILYISNRHDVVYSISKVNVLVKRPLSISGVRCGSKSKRRDVESSEIVQNRSEDEESRSNCSSFLN